MDTFLLFKVNLSSTVMLSALSFGRAAYTLVLCFEMNPSNNSTMTVVPSSK